MSGLSEIERGRVEAAQTELIPTDVAPYLDPPADTPYALRYAFYLAGDLHGKTVLELGCGSGENLAPLLARGAKVIALDISRELALLARKRVAMTNGFVAPPLMVASAYDVPLRDACVDVILCASVVHHLEIPRAMAEMRRLLKPKGSVIVKEPVRFSRIMAVLRFLFPARDDVSEQEHPLTREEVTQVKTGWTVIGERAFRLPLVPLFLRLMSPDIVPRLVALDGWLLKNLPFLQHLSTSRVFRLQKADPFDESQM